MKREWHLSYPLSNKITPKDGHDESWVFMENIYIEIYIENTH